MPKSIDEVIVKWLNRLLGGFVEEIDASSINVAMLGGSAVLENLHIKPNCLQEVGLPVVLSRGTVGRIELTIPVRFSSLVAPIFGSLVAHIFAHFLHRCRRSSRSRSWSRSATC